MPLTDSLTTFVCSRRSAYRLYVSVHEFELPYVNSRPCAEFCESASDSHALVSAAAIC